MGQTLAYLPKDPQHARVWYDTASVWFAGLSIVVLPVLFVINAPFGRFTTQNKNIFNVDGIKSWIVMEAVAPLTIVACYLRAPLAPLGTGPPGLYTPNTFLLALYLAHYANRAFISPLRTSSRAPSLIIVPLSAIIFNLVNASLMGAYLSSPTSTMYLARAFSSPRFWAGVLVWAAGFAGNVAHDEVLLTLRRANKGYGIPHGGLYGVVSYPNYLCEWAEWAGYALAAAPPLSFSPPWLFVLAEVCTMLPRAVRGHQWYLRKFPEYPKERRAVVPFLI